MTFQPILPTGGLVGWRFLQQSYETQLDNFARSPTVNREAAAFADRIGKISSAAELVADRQTLIVALGAFGLSEDINNRYFIRKILEDGSTARDSLANKLADDRYRQFSAAFGFGSGEILQTGNRSAMAGIAQSYVENAFEVAVGQQDDSMRIALYAQRELTELAGEPGSDDTKWFKLMSLPALRTMFETALGLPSSFSQLDIDRQLEEFRDRTSSALGDGSVAQFSDPEQLDRITELYLARAQLADLSASYSPTQTALLLLQR